MLPIAIGEETYTIVLRKPTSEWPLLEMEIRPLNLIKGSIEEKLAEQIARKHEVHLTRRPLWRSNDFELVFVIRLGKAGLKEWEEYAEETTKEIREEMDEAKTNLIRAVKDLHKAINESAEFLIRNLDL